MLSTREPDHTWLTYSPHLLEYRYNFNVLDLPHPPWFYCVGTISPSSIENQRLSLMFALNDLGY